MSGGGLIAITIPSLQCAPAACLHVTQWGSVSVIMATAVWTSVVASKLNAISGEFPILTQNVQASVEAPGTYTTLRHRAGRLECGRSSRVCE